MRYPKASTILAFLLSFTAMRCGIQRGVQGWNNRLRGGNWTLVEAGKPLHVKGKPLYLHFLKTKFQGYTGCNTILGTYRIRGEALSLHKLKSTREKCEERRLEKAFLKLLSRVDRVQIQAETMKLYQDKMLLLKFRRQHTY